MSLSVIFSLLLASQAHASRLVLYNHEMTNFAFTGNISHEDLPREQDQSVGFDIDLVQTINVRHGEGKSMMGRIRLKGPQGNQKIVEELHLSGDIHVLLREKGEMELLEKLLNIHGDQVDLVVDLMEYGMIHRFGALLGLGHTGLHSKAFRLRWKNTGEVSKPVTRAVLKSALKHQGLQFPYVDKEFKPIEMALLTKDKNVNTYGFDFRQGFQKYTYTVTDSKEEITFTVSGPSTTSSLGVKRKQPGANPPQETETADQAVSHQTAALSDEKGKEEANDQ